MEDNRIAALANAVFGQDLLWEKILDHVIPHRNSSNDRHFADIVRPIRLVSRSWHQTVTKLLRKRKEPLFKLLLTANNSVSGAQYVEKNGKILEQFVNGVVNGSPESIPTFTMACRNDFFRRENHESLTDCLQHCGAGLLEVRLGMLENGGSLPPIFPKFVLPRLKRLFILCSPSPVGIPNYQERAYENRSNGTALIHTFLTGAHALEEFSFFGGRNRGPPQYFEYLILPSAITRLSLRCELESIHLDVLLKNSLPNLTTLELLMPEVPFSNGLLFKVLDNFKASLEELHLLGKGNTIHPLRRTSLLRLPVLRRLTWLDVTSTHCELEPNLSSLERRLPRLLFMTILGQTAEMLGKWMKNSQFSTVRNLRVSLANDVAGVNLINNDSNTSSLDLEMMQRIHMGLPYLQQLDLRVSGDHVDVLKYIFREMQKLSLLKVSIVNAAPELNSDFWDAVFIGTTIDMVAGLRTNPDWRLVELGNDDVPSIRMLKGLRTLHLQNRGPTNVVNGVEPQALVSDLVFHFALLRMPKLYNLILFDRFTASAQMTKTWRNQGRILETGPSSPTRVVTYT